MDESADKGLEVNAAIPKSREIGRITVSGYDTKLPRRKIKSALKKLYSSCGEITDVYIPKTYKSLWKHAFIYFLGEGAVDKAVQLNGTDVGGWIVFANAFPFLENADRDDATVSVEGFDSSLSETDIKSALTELFSSCGEMTDVMILDSSAEVDLEGEDVVEKAPKLNGSYMWGHKVVVRLICPQEKPTSHPRRPCSPYGRIRPGCYGRRQLTPPGKKAKIT